VSAALHTRPGILRARLLPPRLPATCLRREPLVARVLGGLSGRVVAVLAGAGYGKSTLLALTLVASDLPWAWCSCDERLDAGLLIAHVAASLGGCFPGFGSGLAHQGLPEPQVAELSNEIAATVSEDFVIALDDLHTLRPAAADAVGMLVRDLPPNAHLALAGRAPLPFRHGRLRAGRALVLWESDLSLSEEEVRALAEATGRGVDAPALHQRAEGWVAGVVLGLEAGPESPPAPRSPPALSAYLAEEVLLRQRPELQRFLVETSILDRFCPDLAAAVTGRSDAAELLRELAAGHAFTIRLDEETAWYRYHHLLQAVLRDQLEAAEAGRAAELHRLAADWWRSAGEPGEAVHHLLAAGDLERAVDALDPVAETMLGTAEAESLAGWLDRIPKALLAGHPGLILAESALLLTRGQHEAAFEASEQAIGTLLDQGDHERAAAALFRLLQSMVAAGTRPTSRIAAAERYVDRIDPATRLLPAVRVLLAASYSYGCRFREAEEELGRALALPGGQAPPIRAWAAMVRAFYIQLETAGCGRDVLDAVIRAGDELERHEAEDALAFLPYRWWYRAYLLADLGRHEEALGEIARAQEEAARRGIRRAPGRVVAYIRFLALAGLDRWEELAAQFALPVRAPGVDEPTSYTYRDRVPAALVAAHRGDVAAVRDQVLAARDEMRAFGRTSDDPMHLADLAVPAADVGLCELARELAEESRSRSAEHGAPWARARAGLAGALADPDGAWGLRCLGEALGLTERHGLDDLWTHRHRRHAPALLARALTAGVGAPGVAVRLAVACGDEAFARAVQAAAASPRLRVVLAEAAGQAREVPAETLEELLRDRDARVRQAARATWQRATRRPRAAIRITSLGYLRVQRDGVAVPESAFSRQSARTLLALLLAAEQPLHREQVAEILWPKLGPGRSAGALRSALYDLRRALEPELAAGDSSSLVAVDTEMLAIVLDEQDSWDVRDFIRLVEGGEPDETPERAIARLGAAEALYQGPFLAEWPYADWAAARRAELLDAHVRAEERLAGAFAAAGRAEDAIARYRRLLLVEPDREGWHRGLMSAFAAAGERALALRQYHSCRTRLRRTQGVEPSEQTRELYLELLRADGTSRAQSAGMATTPSKEA